MDQCFGDGVEAESFATGETAMACRIWLIATTTATAAVIVAVATTATGIADFTLQPVMNRSALKNYAPEARLDFIRAVTDRAALVGLASPNLSNSGVEPDTPRLLQPLVAF